MSDLTHLTPQFNWLCQGQSVLGASHQRFGLPNQDAIACWPDPGAGPPVLLAVSDGHGSGKSFRSHRGSAIAVQLAIAEICQAFRLQPGAARPGLPDPDLHLAEAEAIASGIPQRLVQRWQQMVLAELQTYPITAAEWEHLQTKEGAPACQRVQQHPLLAYGATLLTVLVTDHFICYWQLGDGDILCVDTQGQVSQPFTRDQNLVANATLSLCQERIWPEMRWHLQPLSANAPELILLSTDGYANCFVTEADFQQIGPDYLLMLREQGLTPVMEQLPSILQQASQRGSGDDITLGCIYRQTPQPHPVEPSSSEHSANSPATLLPTRLQTDQTLPPPTHRLIDPQSLISLRSAPSSLTPGLPESELVTEKPVSSIAELLQINRQQTRELGHLRLLLRLMLGVTVLALGLAGFSLWQQLRASHPQLPGVELQPAHSPAPPSGRAPEPSGTEPPAAGQARGTQPDAVEPPVSDPDSRKYTQPKAP